MIPSFRKEKRLKHVLDQIPLEERETFHRVGYTIGGMMVFPGNQIGRQQTINQARGCRPRIKDRFDLTVECIRRHYRNERSPLSDVLGGYVEYSLLQDLVTEDCSAVNFFTSFEDFTTSPVPGSLGAYREYSQRAVGFIETRNRRSDGSIQSHVE